MCRERPEAHQLVEAFRLDDELADVDRPVLAGDVGDHHVDPASVRQRRVDEG